VAARARSSTCARRPSFSLAQDLLVLPFWAFDYGLPLVGPDGRGCAQAALPPSFKEAPFDARSWRRITSSSITRPSRSLLVWLLAWDLCAAQVSRPAGFLGSGLRLSSDPATFPEGGSGPRCLGDSAEGEARVVIFGCDDREVQAFRRYWQVQVRGEVPLCALGDARASCVVPPVLRVVRLPSFPRLCCASFGWVGGRISALGLPRLGAAPGVALSLLLSRACCARLMRSMRVSISWR